MWVFLHVYNKQETGNPNLKQTVTQKSATQKCAERKCCVSVTDKSLMNCRRVGFSELVAGT